MDFIIKLAGDGIHTPPHSKSSRSKLHAKLNSSSSGASMDFNKLPQNIREAALVRYVDDVVQANIKKLDPETATFAQVKAAAEEAISWLYEGRTTSGTKASPRRNLVRDDAKRLLKKFLKESFENKNGSSPDAKKLTAKVTATFKALDEFKKFKGTKEEAEQHPAFKPAKLAQKFMLQAEAARKALAESMAAAEGQLDDLAPEPGKEAPAPKAKAPKAKAKATGKSA